jgi:hypothetical protein
MSDEAVVAGGDLPPWGQPEVNGQGPPEAPSGAPPGVAKRKRQSLPVPDPLVGLLPLRELSKALGLPYKWLRRLTRQGKLPCAKIGNRILYDLKRVADKVREACKYRNQHGKHPKDING